MVRLLTLASLLLVAIATLSSAETVLDPIKVASDATQKAMITGHSAFDVVTRNANHKTDEHSKRLYRA